MKFPPLCYTREKHPSPATVEQQERYNALIDDILQHAPSIPPEQPLELLRLLHEDFAALDAALIRRGSLRAPLRRLLGRGMNGQAVEGFVMADKGWSIPPNVVPRISLGKASIAEGFDIQRQEAIIYGTDDQFRAPRILRLARTCATGTIAVADQVFTFSPERPNIALDLLTIGPGFLQNGEKYHYWPHSGQFDAFRTHSSPLSNEYEEDDHHLAFEHRLDDLRLALGDLGIASFAVE